jgi:hypothetical protein
MHLNDFELMGGFYQALQYHAAEVFSLYVITYLVNFVAPIRVKFPKVDHSLLPYKAIRMLNYISIYNYVFNFSFIQVIYSNR